MTERSLKNADTSRLSYLANGAQLGWLIDAEARRVYVYRPGTAVECREHLSQLSGDPALPGFVLDLAPIWEPGV